MSKLSYHHNQGGSLPKTQSIEGVTAMLKAIGRQTEPVPAFVELARGVVLVRSKKGDAYYVTTPNGCSCPSATYRPGQVCKHQRQHFPSTVADEDLCADLIDFKPAFKYSDPVGVV